MLAILMIFPSHCPEHFGEPLRQHCLCCHRQESGWMMVARGRHGAEFHCRYCAVALYHWSRGKPAPLSASLQVTLQLESTLIDCLRGQPPDSFWVSPVDADDFVSLAADLLAMLTRRDSQEALTLADHLAATDWWDDHVLGYQAVTTLERQEHAISRLKIVAALTKNVCWGHVPSSSSVSTASDVWEGRACTPQKRTIPINWAKGGRPSTTDIQNISVRQFTHRSPGSFDFPRAR